MGRSVARLDGNPLPSNWALAAPSPDSWILAPGSSARITLIPGPGGLISTVCFIGSVS
jgi:hypothetical protein